MPGDEGSITAPASLRSLLLSGFISRDLSDSQLTVRLLWCLRRGLRLKDGPGSARAATVSVWLMRGFILSPSARTGLADLAPRAKVGQTVGCSTFIRGAKPATRRVADGERMNPQGKERAYATMQKTMSTRAMSAELARPRIACPLRPISRSATGTHRNFRIARYRLTCIKAG